MAISFPAFGEKKQKLTIFSVEECTSCHERVKRPFQNGDYVYKEAGECAKCKGRMRVIMVYGEEPPKKQTSAKSKQ